MAVCEDELKQLDSTLKNLLREKKNAKVQLKNWFVRQYLTIISLCGVLWWQKTLYSENSVTHLPGLTSCRVSVNCDLTTDQTTSAIWSIKY